MADKTIGPKQTQNEFDRTASTLALDLTAYNKTLQEEAEKVVRRAENEGWTEDEFIYQIGELV